MSSSCNDPYFFSYTNRLSQVIKPGVFCIVLRVNMEVVIREPWILAGLLAWDENRLAGRCLLICGRQLSGNVQKCGQQELAEHFGIFCSLHFSSLAPCDFYSFCLWDLAEGLLLQGCIVGSSGFNYCVAGCCICWPPEMFWTSVAMQAEAYSCWRTIFWKHLYLWAFSGSECFEAALFINIILWSLDF